jgi:hypothetical protein
MNELGIHLGDNADPPVYEDLRLSRAFETGDAGQCRGVIDDYNRRFDIWGWKRPGSIDYLADVDRQLRDPRYLVVFKDVFSIANRNRISMADDVVGSMERAVQGYRKITDFLQRHKPCAMLISYDKALRNREHFVESVARFAGCDASPEAKAQAMDFISPDPTAYAEATRGDRIVGHLDVATPVEVSGWAAIAVTPKGCPPLSVELWVNGQRSATVKANLLRKDVLAAGVHPDGHAGYRFDLSQQPLRSGDSVRVLAGHDGAELAGSPVTIE